MPLSAVVYMKQQDSVGSSVIKDQVFFKSFLDTAELVGCGGKTGSTFGYNMSSSRKAQINKSHILIDTNVYDFIMWTLQWKINRLLSL